MKSIIYSLSQEDFKKLVASKSSIADVLRYFNLHVGAGNYKTCNKRIIEENINTTHFIKGYENVIKKEIPLKDILINNSSYHSSSLKKRILKAELLENKCYICGQLPTWNNKPLVLQLDHINGISNDNRLENLRILCPHCHSQTDTFSGKNSSLNKKHNCIDCKAKISENSIRCLNCSSNKKSLDLKNKNTKINWPELDLLVEMVSLHGYTGTGKILGLSDNVIRKRIKKQTNNKP